ncbi:conjugal transfer protein TraI [Belliella sp. DSM 111904]|uniref:Conjugal transfer protein TraI n=1 Tax=Belliella filtrata TaxID=2923435 RepID=A0ABS9UXT5_9BACT|nr:conjugal transfer protein TraI [Belliella filtrata]MCH7408981.1 conjugal transfer protein TraI [Belliella filtrata]
MKINPNLRQYVLSKTLCLLLLSLMVCAEPKPAQAAPLVIAEVIKQGIKRVIIAVDLRIQRLQNESIWLQNTQKTIENALSKLRLEEIADWTNRQQILYQDYYQGLWRVKSIISQYQRLKDIAQTQAALVAAYQDTWRLLSSSGNFTALELNRKQQIYGGILEESIKHLDQLAFLMKDQLSNMGDASRLEQIHQLGLAIQLNYDELRRYNRHNLLISQYRNNLRKEHQTLQNLQP